MGKTFSSKRNILFFVGPAFFIFLIFGLIPIIYNLILSLFRTDLMSPSSYIGLKNYINLFHDSIFLGSLGNNLLMVIGSMLAHLPIALLLAGILFDKVKGSNFFQSIFFLPCVICGAAIGLTWSFIYNSEFGLVNRILDILGLVQLKHQWLSEEKTVMISIIFVIMWQYVGYHCIIQLAAMKNIPASLFEAAAIDGASKGYQFFHVTLPLIKPILKIDAVLIITGSLKYFDLVFAMTGGGPNHSSEVLSTYMYYQGFRTLKYGYASAIGNVLVLLCIVAVAISNTVFKSKDVKWS